MHDRGHAQQVAQRPAPWRPFCRLVWACSRPDRPRMDRHRTGSPRPGRVCGNFGRWLLRQDVSPCACIFLRTVISVYIYLSIYPFQYPYTHTHIQHMLIRTQIRVKRACKWPGLCRVFAADHGPLQLPCSCHTHACVWQLHTVCGMAASFGSGARRVLALVNAVLRVSSGIEWAACMYRLILLET